VRGCIIFGTTLQAAAARRNKPTITRIRFLLICSGISRIPAKTIAVPAKNHVALGENYLVFGDCKTVFGEFKVVFEDFDMVFV
jgi:hypothetical protein